MIYFYLVGLLVYFYFLNKTKKNKFDLFTVLIIRYYSYTKTLEFLNTELMMKLIKTVFPFLIPFFFHFHFLNFLWIFLCSR